MDHDLTVMGTEAGFSAWSLVARSCALLDAEDYVGWLALFADDARYEVHAYSPEIRQTQVWMQADMPELRALVGQVDNHFRDRAERVRTMTPILIEYDAADGVVTMASRVVIFRTSALTGESSLYALTTYRDRLKLSPRSLILSRAVTLHSRSLPVGSHQPL